jgi:hypothetical protein
MLKTIARKASHARLAKDKEVFNYSVVVFSCSNVPRAVGDALFVFKRGDHEFESTAQSQTDGSLFWNERVSTTATLYRKPDGAFEDKEYTLTLFEAVAAPRGVKRGPLVRCAAVPL